MYRGVEITKKVFHGLRSGTFLHRSLNCNKLFWKLGSFGCCWDRFFMLNSLSYIKIVAYTIKIILLLTKSVLSLTMESHIFPKPNFLPSVLTYLSFHVLYTIIWTSHCFPYTTFIYYLHTFTFVFSPALNIILPISHPSEVILVF